VREDYSEGGDAWDYFTHDQARSRTYRWGEEGIAGLFDDKQRLCFALALWNGKDPILKERIFGLTNSEGNHGEDVKEYYFYLDSTPTHSCMKLLYKYPQAAFPYADLVETNRRESTGYPYTIYSLGKIEAVDSGQVILQESEPGKDFYIIVDGAFSIIQGNHKLIRLGTGDFFGELPILEDNLSTVTIKATAACMAIAP
jgi:hypothetical protein